MESKLCKLMLVVVAALALPSIAASEMRCSDLTDGFDSFCSKDLTKIIRCDSQGRKTVVAHCPNADCYLGYNGPECQSVTHKKHGVGPTDCSEVQADGTFICIDNYSKLAQCFTNPSTGKFEPTEGYQCGRGCCSSAGSGQCPASC